MDNLIKDNVIIAIEKQALATYLLALAQIEGNNRTHVHREMLLVIDELNKQFNL
ncbi:hypothetical protein ACFOZ1_07980 [Gracilibacillus marinus]|uniref:Spo0E like sporulation regulatory protein n=1 Tax=Gracilibacillus marinus TaxID=630535 RepID=A0ABV8VTG2_9BACI